MSELDTNTVASTHAESRKASSTHHAAELDGGSEDEFVDIEDEIDEEFKEGTQ